MILSILKIVETVLSLFGMEAQRRKEIQAAILKESINRKKDHAQIAKLRGEYVKLLKEIKKEQRSLKWIKKNKA